MFITFEGGEGAGKSTQIQRLANRLKTQDRTVICLREPGSSAGAEAIRNLVLNGDTDRWHAVEELFLFSAARHELVRTKIKPALDSGGIVLCDRFADSSAIYQGRAGGVGQIALQTIEDLATHGIEPDLTFLIDVPVGIGLARANQRISGITSDLSEARFEGKDVAFHEAVRHAFLQRADQFSARFRVIDGTQSQEQVGAAVWHHVESIVAAQ